MESLVEYLKAQGATTASKVVGPRGAFISYSVGKGKKAVVHTLPVGGKSQNGSLAEYGIFITEDGQAIATVNEYEVEETLKL